MIEIIDNQDKYLYLFDDYPVFELYLEHAINNMDYKIFVDNLENSQAALLFAAPAFLLVGNPNMINKDDLKSILKSGSWIISPSNSWDVFLVETFAKEIDSYPRVLFDESEIDLLKLESLRKPLPEELKIVPVEKKHLEKGMLKHEIIDKFFVNIDFLNAGFGLVLENAEGVVHGFAVTNYPVTTKDKIEVTYRVGYDTFDKYRNKGIGTTLVSLFIEDSIKRGLKPLWDAANQTSAHIALKLGYIEKKHWLMHHIK